MQCPTACARPTPSSIASRRSFGRGLILGAVINHEDLVPVTDRAQITNDGADRVAFVERGDDDAYEIVFHDRAFRKNSMESAFMRSIFKSTEG